MSDKGGIITEKEISFPGNEPFFKGHFPGSPVTPGVMLIDKAVAAAKVFKGDSAVLKCLKKVKFSAPVPPDCATVMRLEDLCGAEVRFSFLKDGSLCASGVMVFDR